MLGSVALLMPASDAAVPLTVPAPFPIQLPTSVTQILGLLPLSEEEFPD